MNTRDLMLVGAGVVVGYLLVGFLNKSKDNAQTTGSASSVDQAKLADCTKKIEEEMAVTRFKTTANFDINAYKKDAIDRCLKGGAM